VQQQAAHDAEHRGRRADTERQSEYRDHRPALLSAKGANCESDILSQIVENLSALHASLAVTRGFEEPRS
jgi:hypothetical protein